MIYYDDEDLDFPDSIKLEKRREMRLQAIKERQAFIIKRNKTYLKGRRGVRLYYDYDRRYDDDDEDANRDADLEYGYDPYEDKHRQVKCVFKQALRREKLFAYLKYLKGRKILVRDLAWKFAVTERTIQHDLRWLENGGDITTQKNKTFQGKQTKNSYIVNLEMEKQLPCEDTYLNVVFISNVNDVYYILTKTSYAFKKNSKKKIPISYYDFDLPMMVEKFNDRIDDHSLRIAKNIFGKDLRNSYKGQIFVNLYKGCFKDIDRYGKEVTERYKQKDLFSLFVLKEKLQPKRGHLWIKLSLAPRRLCNKSLRKCIKYIIDNLLG